MRVAINEHSGYFGGVEGVLYSDRYDCEVALLGKKVSGEYLTKCAEYFENLPEALTARLATATAVYLAELISEHEDEFDLDAIPEITAENVTALLFPVELCTEPVGVLDEEDTPPVFSAKLAFSPVPDEFVEWTVRDDMAVYAGEYRGISPWNEKVAAKKWNYLNEV